MTAPNINQNILPSDPQLKDVLDLFKRDVMLSLNCHHIGTIESFDADRQLARVSINYKKTFVENRSVNSFKQKALSYPIAIDCPVVILGGGVANLTMPIKKGDECLLLFNDRDMDNWWSGSNNGEVASPRLHSFADAIALVGIRSLGKKLADYDLERAVLRANTGAIGVRLDNGKILICNDYPDCIETLNSLLQELITAIKAITHPYQLGDGVNPGGLTQNTSTPNNASTFTDIANRLGDVLE